MATTISVSDATRRRLMALKLREGAKSMDELLQRMEADHRKLRLIEVSEKMRNRIKELGLEPKDLLR